MTDDRRDNVDWKMFEERVERIVEHHFQTRSGGGEGGGLEARIEKLEIRFAEFEKKLDRVESQMAKGVDLARLEGRVSQLPTIWQIAGLILVIFGAAFTLLRFGLPHS